MQTAKASLLHEICFASDFNASGSIVGTSTARIRVPRPQPTAAAYSFLPHFTHHRWLQAATFCHLMTEFRKVFEF